MNDVQCRLSKRDTLPKHDSVAFPVKPSLHLHEKWPGRLQHSAFSAQSPAKAGTSHSFVSGWWRMEEEREAKNV